MTGRYNGRFWFSVRTTGVYCLPSCAARPAAAPERGVPRLARSGRGGGFPGLQALQAARLAGRCRPQQAGGARLRDVRFDRRRHGALARRGGAPGRPVERRAQQALHRRAGRQSARLAGGAQAPALPQGIARGRVGGRRALWRGLRFAEPRLRDQRQGARHDARHLCQGRRRGAYRLHHGRFRLWPRAGGGDAEGHRRGIPGRQRPHARKGPEARLPGRRHHAQRPRAGAAREERAGPPLRPQAVRARRGGRAARYRRHRLPMEGLEGLDRDPAGPDQELRRDRQAHRRTHGGARRRPRLRHQPGGRGHSLPPRRRRSAAGSTAIAGAWRARSGCWPTNAGAAARRRRRRRRAAGAPAARRAPGCDCRHGSASR